MQKSFIDQFNLKEHIYLIRFILHIYYGIKDVFSHKLRATLSILGVVFGIAAVISMVSISEGAKRDVVRQIEMLGVDNMSIIPKRIDDEADGTLPLIYKDYEVINKLGFVQKASPVKTKSSDISFQDKVIKADLFGVNEDYNNILGLTLDEGRFLTPADTPKVNNICVIGADVKSALFGLGGAAGKLIKVENDWYKVVGVLKERQRVKKTSATSFKNIDSAVIIPLSAMYKTNFMLFEKPLSEITLTISPDYDKDIAIKRLTALMLKNHPKKGFDVTIPSELIAQSYETQRVFNIVLGIIAAISLLVGGIGIMNIMLASVTERTREIGIRRAIGAKKSDIMRQFVFESLLLTSLGGIIGIVSGIAAASYINYKAGWPIHISPAGVFLALLMSSGTGMIFGIYPAMKAAMLHPIEALRYE